MRKFIVLALLAMASPAWACVIGEPGWLDKCDKKFAQAGGACSDGLWIEGKCVKGGGGGSGRVPPTSCLDLPDLVQVGDICVAKYPDFPLRACWPFCPGSYVTCADPSKVLVGDKCVTMTDVDDAPRIQIPPSRSFERAPNAIYTVNGPGGICLAGNMAWADGKCEPLIEPGPTLKCSDGYTALTYPGTWHWVCARDVREPK